MLHEERRRFLTREPIDRETNLLVGVYVSPRGNGHERLLKPCGQPMGSTKDGQIPEGSLSLFGPQGVDDFRENVHYVADYA